MAGKPLTKKDLDNAFNNFAKDFRKIIAEDRKGDFKDFRKVIAEDREKDFENFRKVVAEDREKDFKDFRKVIAGDRAEENKKLSREIADDFHEILANFESGQLKPEFRSLEAKIHSLELQVKFLKQDINNAMIEFSDNFDKSKFVRRVTKLEKDIEKLKKEVFNKNK